MLGSPLASVSSRQTLHSGDPSLVGPWQSGQDQQQPQPIHRAMSGSYWFGYNKGCGNEKEDKILNVKTKLLLSSLQTLLAS